MSGVRCNVCSGSERVFANLMPSNLTSSRTSNTYHLTSIMLPPIPTSWRTQLKAETQQPYFQKLEKFLEVQRQQFKVYPPEADTFQALELTPYENVNVLLLGQDPYPSP